MTTHDHARVAAIRNEAMIEINDAVDAYDRKRMHHARYVESGEFRLAYHFRMQADHHENEARYQANRLWRVGMRATSNEILRDLRDIRRTHDCLLKEVKRRLRRAAK